MPIPLPVFMPPVSADPEVIANTVTLFAGIGLALLLVASAGLWLFFPEDD